MIASVCVLLNSANVQASTQEVLSNLQPLLNELPSTNPVAQEVASISQIISEQQLDISSSTLTDVLTRLLLRVRHWPTACSHASICSKPCSASDSSGQSACTGMHWQQDHCMQS